MNTRRFAKKLCWFGASALALGAFGFIVVWFDTVSTYPFPPARDALLILSAGALVVMVFLVVLAFAIERKTDASKR
ncbi:MAG: hypothetical protein ACXWCY_20800 [Burkholderiales bacterium]